MAWSGPARHRAGRARRPCRPANRARCSASRPAACPALRRFPAPSRRVRRPTRPRPEGPPHPARSRHAAERCAHRCTGRRPRPPESAAAGRCRPAHTPARPCWARRPPRPDRAIPASRPPTRPAGRRAASCWRAFDPRPHRPGVGLASSSDTPKARPRRVMLSNCAR